MEGEYVILAICVHGSVLVDSVLFVDTAGALAAINE